MKYFLLFFFLISGFSIKAQVNLKDDFRVYLDNDTALANTYTQKNIFIIADSTPIYKNAKLKVIFPKYFNDFAYDNMFWILIPPNFRAGYLQVRSVSSGKMAVVNSANLCISELTTKSSNLFDYKFGHENNQYVVTITMSDTLPIGDTLQIIYGANGSSTFTYNSNASHSDNFSILLDNNNSGTFTALYSQAKLTFKQLSPKLVNLSLASTGKVGRNALLRISVLDQFKNSTNNFNGTVNLTCTDAGAILPNSISFVPADKGVKVVSVSFSQLGVFSISATVSNSNFPITGSFVSNPINISEDSLNVYWGDFHTHTKFSRDGFGDEGYRYARDAMGLDFYCGTDHADYEPVDTFGINLLEWAKLKNEVISYAVPGKFVTFLGYENSLDNPSGHYNFIYNFEDSLINSIPNIPRHFDFTIQNIWTRLNNLSLQEKVLTIPHHTGILFGTTGSDNGATGFGGTLANFNYKRNIEIFSGHGQGEYYNPSHNLAYEKFGGRSTKFPCYAQDAWAIGEKLSVIASTDSHNGHMAQSNSGIAAIISDTLTRSALFNGLYNRHTYGTTGEKMMLKFSMDKSIMGDEMSVPCDSFPTLHFEVNGTDVLDFIEILKWDFKTGQYTSNPVHPIFTVIEKISFPSPKKNFTLDFIDTKMTDTSLYYVRVKQKNLVNNKEVWAWSSPIWVNKPHCDTIFKTDSLYNFHLLHTQPAIDVFWCMKDEFKTDYFIVERSSGDTFNFIPLDTIQTVHIAFVDSCYHYVDRFPNDSVLYYRIKRFNYDNSFQYSKIDSIKIPFVIDSVYGLDATVLRNSIQIDWKANEYFVTDYQIQKKQKNTGFQTFSSKNAASGMNPKAYALLDFLPLKDTSYYRVIMNLPNGSFKFSNLDSIVFRTDSLFDFNTNLKGDTIIAKWHVEHEQEIVRYELERSQNRVSFFSLVTVVPTGNLFDTASYQFIDTTALAGWNYYRVLQYLIDGSIKTSTLDSERIINTGVHNTATSKNVEINLLSNLVDEGKSYLQYISTSKQVLEGTFLIVGADGRLYYTKKDVLNSGKQIGSIPIGGFSTGVYYLLFITDEFVVKQSFVIAQHGGCDH